MTEADTTFSAHPKNLYGISSLNSPEFTDLHHFYIIRNSEGYG